MAGGKNKVRQPIRIYQIAPHRFKRLRDIQDYLPQIAAQGFSHIWLPPLFDTVHDDSFYSRSLPVTTEEVSVTASCYATDIYGEWGTYPDCNEENLKQFLQAAKQNYGLEAIADCVFNHVHVNSQYFRQSNYSDIAKLYKLEVDSKWNDVRFLKENLNRYELKRLIEKIVIPTLKAYKKLGFSGIRIDAASSLPTSVLTSISQAADTIFPTDFVKLAEWLGEKAPDAALCLSDLRVPVNTAYYNYKSYDIGPALSKLMLDLQEKECMLGDTFGFPSSHDTATLFVLCADWYFETNGGDDALKEFIADYRYTLFSNDNILRPDGSTPQKIKSDDIRLLTIMRMIREQATIAAFAPKSGWIWQAGDELGMVEQAFPFAEFNDRNHPILTHGSCHAYVNSSVQLDNMIREYNAALSLLQSTDLTPYEMDVMIFNRADDRAGDLDKNSIYSVIRIHHLEKEPYVEVVSANVLTGEIVTLTDDEKHTVIKKVEQQVEKDSLRFNFITSEQVKEAQKNFLRLDVVGSSTDRGISDCGAAKFHLFTTCSEAERKRYPGLGSDGRNRSFSAGV